MDMDAKIDFLYLSEPDMIKAGVKDMKDLWQCRRTWAAVIRWLE